MKKSTIGLIVGFVLLWNSGFIGAEYGLPYTGPFSLIFWRYLGVTLILFFYLLANKSLFSLRMKAVPLNMLIGALSHGVWLTCVLVSIDKGIPAGIVALIVSLQPLATGALSSQITGESISWKQWLGLFLGFAGVVFTVAFRVDFTDSNSILGYFIPLGAVLSITIATLFQRKIDLNESKHKLPVEQTLFLHGLASILILIFPAWFLENLTTQWASEFIVTLGWLTLVVSIGAYGIMWLLIERLSATKVASLFYLGPPVTMFMAWLAFGDVIRITDMLGMLIVAVGVLITYLKKSSKTEDKRK